MLSPPSNIPGRGVGGGLCERHLENTENTPEWLRLNRVPWPSPYPLPRTSSQGITRQGRHSPLPQPPPESTLPTISPAKAGSPFPGLLASPTNKSPSCQRGGAKMCIGWCHTHAQHPLLASPSLKIKTGYLHNPQRAPASAPPAPTPPPPPSTTTLSISYFHHSNSVILSPNTSRYSVCAGAGPFP